MSAQGEEKATLNRLYKLKKEILKSDNDVLVSQIDHAIQKTYNEQLVFSFIGHYSAGKSSLINHLIGMDILPSSPVPTTSNTVSVQISEDNKIEAFINQYQYAAVNNYDELKVLNTLDLDIQAITMDVQHDDFNINTVFQDTPGVDSNTSSHEESANRFLLNSDVIFFTVEYNHVESEHNLKLLREIQELNIPLCLIINQIDKHDDHELTLDTFLRRVKSTLDNWDIHPEHIFTTSIYDTPYNQIDDLKKYIKEIESRKEMVEQYDQRIMHNIEQKQIEYLEDKIEALEHNLNTDRPLNLERAKERIHYLEQEINEAHLSDLRSDQAVLENHVKDNVRKLVKDAYIFPHQVKDAIIEYLKILAGEKKPTGLFGKKKKEEEMLNTSVNDIKEVIQKVIDTEINANVNNLYKTLGLSGPPFKYDWHSDLLGKDENISLNQSYIKNYFDKLKSTLEREVSTKAKSHLSQLTIENMGETKASSTLEHEKSLYIEVKQLLELLESLTTKNYQHLYIHMDDELDKLNLTEEIEIDTSTDKIQDDTESRHNNFTVDNNEAYSVDYFKQVSQHLEDLPRYNNFKHLIDHKVHRIETGKANISVFGGFSAGKTTFINALLGQARLTTSPNPTTATITEINDNESSSGEMKSEADLTETLQTLSGETHDTVKGYKKWMKANIDKVQETYKPLLRGLLNKYDQYVPILNSKQDFDTDTLIEMISNDEDATFIHKANVSIPNEITKHYNLIDSPGINSINQRHTSETRDIISQSDMIIYVSYYNHVFSRSDETFLKYIQSLKGEDFPLIFIINAVDLMKSEEDKKKVIDYMSNALNKLQIKHVIYSVSSKKAIQSGDHDFDLAKTDIRKITDQQARNVQLRTLSETTNQLINTVASNIKQFEDSGQERQRIIEGRNALRAEIESLSAKQFIKVLKQEIDIILTYLPKRLELQVYDHLKGLITVSEMRDKHYLSKHSTLVSKNIDSYLTLETGVAFNAIYRQADNLTNQRLTQFNERLGEFGSAGSLSIDTAYADEPKIQIDETVLQSYEKALYKNRKDTSSFRNTLLDLAKDLSASINIEALEGDMVSLTKDYLERLDEQFMDEKAQVYKALGEPVKEISEEDYKADQTLYSNLTDLKIEE